MKYTDFETGCIVKYTRPNEITIRFKCLGTMPSEFYSEVLVFEQNTGRLIGLSDCLEQERDETVWRTGIMLTAELRLGHYLVLLMVNGRLIVAYDCHHKRFDEKATRGRRHRPTPDEQEMCEERNTQPLSEERIMRDELQEAMAELDQMVGLGELKQQMRRIFQSVCFNRYRQKVGLRPVGNMAYHCIFSGNPGTGKTTVARLLGRVMYRMQVLSKGEVICHDRRSLMGQYIGETENKFTEVLEQAKGNVLFIDEAYSLLSERDSKDFGRHIIESLLTAITQPDCDMVVILAGYRDEMKRLVESNPGIASRFAYHFTFDDFSAAELMDMAERLLSRHQMCMTGEARKELLQVLDRAVASRDKFFGNGRWLTTFIEQHMIQAMAERIMDRGVYTRDALCIIHSIDISRAAEADSYLCQHRDAKTSRRIGFVA